jgi:hypothetical protein
VSNLCSCFLFICFLLLFRLRKDWLQLYPEKNIKELECVKEETVHSDEDHLVSDMYHDEEAELNHALIESAKEATGNASSPVNSEILLPPVRQRFGSAGIFDDLDKAQNVCEEIKRRCEMENLEQENEDFNQSNGSIDPPLIARDLFNDDFQFEDTQETTLQQHPSPSRKHPDGGNMIIDDSSSEDDMDKADNDEEIHVSVLGENKSESSSSLEPCWSQLNFPKPVSSIVGFLTSPKPFKIPVMKFSACLSGNFKGVPISSKDKSTSDFSQFSFHSDNDHMQKQNGKTINHSSSKSEVIEIDQPSSASPRQSPSAPIEIVDDLSGSEKEVKIVNKRKPIDVDIEQSSQKKKRNNH